MDFYISLYVSNFLASTLSNKILENQLIANLLALIKWNMIL